MTFLYRANGQDRGHILGPECNCFLCRNDCVGCGEGGSGE